MVSHYDYSEFAALCTQYGYTFEPHVVETQDFWQITVFEITGYLDPTSDLAQNRPNLTKGKDPILAIPGSFGDAQTWFYGPQLVGSSDKPMHLQLYDQGYDLWMGNNRGTKYSNVNPQWSTEDESFDHWDFSWAEIGLYDDTAFIDYIIEKSADSSKVNYIGYSMGTTQMFYGLAHLESIFHKTKLNKFIALAPCIYLEHENYEQYEFGIGAYRELGVNVICGPQWESHLEAICTYLASEQCNAYQTCLEPQPTKSREWYYQISVENRWQEYSPRFLDGERIKPLIKPGLASIKHVPMHFVVGTRDEHCSLSQAERVREEIGSAVKSIDIIQGADHGYFDYATDQHYVNTILDILAIDETQTHDN